MKVELDLSNYTTKEDFKNATGVDTSKFARKVDLASLKSEIGKLDINKLETTPVDLSKLSDAVKSEVVKKTEYNKSVKKLSAVQNADTSNLVKKITMTQKLLKLKRKYIIMIIVASILLLKNLIS